MEPVDNNANEGRRKLDWTNELHYKFLDVVNILGGIRGKDTVPNNILKLMNEPGLTRAQVASHLQKYRENKENGWQRRNKLVRHNEQYENLIIQQSYHQLDASSSSYSSLQVEGSSYPMSQFQLGGYVIPNNEDNNSSYSAQSMDDQEIATQMPSVSDAENYNYSSTQIGQQQSLVPSLSESDIYADLGEITKLPNENIIQQDFFTNFYSEVNIDQWSPTYPANWQ